jgi:hypothetical protein
MADGTLLDAGNFTLLYALHASVASPAGTERGKGCHRDDGRLTGSENDAREYRMCAGVGQRRLREVPGHLRHPGLAPGFKGPRAQRPDD